MPRNAKRPENNASPVTDANVWGMIRSMANDNTDESRLLELYYWSQEPGVMELVRAYLEMDERARLTLGNFMLTTQPRSIVASCERSGALTLTQSEITAPSAAKASPPAAARPQKRAARRS